MYTQKVSLNLQNFLTAPSNKRAAKMNCEAEEKHYSTPYDGQNNFHCFKRQCAGLKAILRCFGDYSHNFPLPHHPNVAAEVAWKFMKHHPRNE